MWGLLDIVVDINFLNLWIKQCNYVFGGHSCHFGSQNEQENIKVQIYIGPFDFLSFKPQWVGI